MDEKEYTTPLHLATASNSLNHEPDDSLPNSESNRCCISEALLDDIKMKSCIFEIEVETDTQEILIHSTTLTYSETRTSHVYEINTFLNAIQLDEEIVGERFKYVAEELIYSSLRFPEATVFKVVWPKLSQFLVGESCLELLKYFSIRCRFKDDSDYVQCLCLILKSPSARNLKTSFMVNGTIYHILLGFRSKNINPRERAVTIVHALRVVNTVELREIACAYKLYGFNDEVILLLISTNFKIDRSRCFEILGLIKMFILKLDTDPHLSFNKIDDLGLVPKRAYLKLIKLLPVQILRQEECASIEAKREILNACPTLYEISKYHLQKHLQMYYKIKEQSEFCKTVDNLPLPKVIKENLCKYPPLYYKLRIQ